MISNELISFMVKRDKKGLTRNELVAFAHAFIYEPGNEYGKLGDSSAFKYISDKPASLPKYLLHFCPPDGSIKITNDLKMRLCIGIEGVNAEHYYLDVEGSFMCNHCPRRFCRTCGYDPAKDRGKISIQNLLQRHGCVIMCLLLPRILIPTFQNIIQ